MPQKSGCIRIINDLSWPIKKSINEFVPANDFSLSYTSVDMAVQRIQLFDDPLVSNDWNLLGFKWHDQYYVSMCLVFG